MSESGSETGKIAENLLARPVDETNRVQGAQESVASTVARDAKDNIDPKRIRANLVAGTEKLAGLEKSENYKLKSTI